MIWRSSCMARQTRLRAVTAAQSRSYLAKAEEFLAGARSELGAGRAIAATSLAIHAGINAADAVTGARLGQRAAGQDHDQVLSLLRDAGSDGIDWRGTLHACSRSRPRRRTPQTTSPCPKPSEQSTCLALRRHRSKGRPGTGVNRRLRNQARRRAAHQPSGVVPQPYRQFRPTRADASMQRTGDTTGALVKSLLASVIGIIILWTIAEKILMALF